MRLVVCAAVKHKDTGVVICGARHGDCINFLISSKLDINPGPEWECGFVDQYNEFMTRSEAWKVADKAGLIRRPSGWEQDFSKQRAANIGDEALLFSENLY